ncbi:hypothetical protein [Streptomyces triculaminicus]|uniref:hypothetical protein n=1 Tax=Streptomyces triculaminicus TaxID=2816232 RepID=UPI00379916DE
MLTALLAPCANTNSTTAAKAAAPARDIGKPPTAEQAFESMALHVKSVRAERAVTAEDDPNHLMGRPGQYTSKVVFTDIRIPQADAQMY